METPVVLRADVDKNTYRGFALSQLRILKDEMQIRGLSTSARTVVLANGVIIKCSKSFKQEFIDIYVPKNVTYTEEIKQVIKGFAAHPKAGDAIHQLPYYDNEMTMYYAPAVYGGGWSRLTGEWVEIEDRIHYSLVDNDRGTFTINTAKIKDEKRIAVNWSGTNNENYGNNWWSNKNGSDVLSWKGPPNNISIASNYNIPGLSRQERIIGNDAYYTVFDVYVYKDKSILCHCPQYFEDDEMASLVVGACFVTDTSGVKWLVVFVHTRIENALWHLQIYKSKDLCKTYDLIGTFQIQSRARISACISQDGKTFLYDDTLFKINDDVNEVVCVTGNTAEAEGFRLIEGAGGYGSQYTYEGSTPAYTKLLPGDVFNVSTLDIKAEFKYHADGDGGLNTEKVPSVKGRADSVTIEMTSGSAVPCKFKGSGRVVAFVAQPIGGSYCTTEWSGVDCYKGLLAGKLVQKCNRDYTVSVTLQPQGVVGTYTHTAKTADIVVSGPGAIALGSTYFAANAFPEVKWSISKGAIDPDTGVITSITGASCGSAVVTATDGCGRTGSMRVKCPTGVWVEQPSMFCCVNNPTPCGTLRCNEYNCGGCDFDSGGLREHYEHMPAWICSLMNCNDPCPNNCGIRHNLINKTVYFWECP